MNKYIQRLDTWGANTQAALNRMLNDEDLYLSLLMDYKDTFGTEDLFKALEDNSIEEAFEIAHTMKGVYGNLGLDPMYKIVCQIVEILRAKKMEGLKKLTEDLKQKTDEFLGLLKEE